MPATYPTQSIFLETCFFGHVSEELRLSCSAVTIHRDEVSIAGLEARHLHAIQWMPDTLSFELYGRHYSFKVARPVVVDALSARFTLR